MLPEVWTIPLVNYEVPGYGLMLTVAFLSGSYFAAKRAERVRANPDLVLNLCIFAMIGSMIGARVFYVVHYWQRDFAGRPNPITAVLDITKGGMEFLGGVIGALVLIIGYLLIKRESLRLYFDILTPSLMWGLAIGRLGCFLNGCCFGGICADTTASHWATAFPYQSPAFVSQYRQGLIDWPDPLELTDQSGKPLRIPRKHLHLKPEEFRQNGRKLATAKRNYEQLLKLDAESPVTRAAKATVEKYEILKLAEDEKYKALYQALEQVDSKEFPGRKITRSELAAVADQHKSQAVHPTQVYSSINALFACVFLTICFRIRKRHGMVFAIWLMTYPWTRFIIEIVRVDNPKDTFGGLTISQGMSIFMVLAGIVLAIWLHRLPLRSPAAIPWEPPSEDDQPSRK